MHINIVIYIALWCHRQRLSSEIWFHDNAAIVYTVDEGHLLIIVELKWQQFFFRCRHRRRAKVKFSHAVWIVSQIHTHVLWDNKCIHLMLHRDVNWLPSGNREIVVAETWISVYDLLKLSAGIFWWHSTLAAAAAVADRKKHTNYISFRGTMSCYLPWDFRTERFSPCMCEWVGWWVSQCVKWLPRSESIVWLEKWRTKMKRKKVFQRNSIHVVHFFT